MGVTASRGAARALDERTPSVAIVHDYLTQRGGAERVVLSMLNAFPDAWPVPVRVANRWSRAPLRAWDRRAASIASAYLANSSVVRARVRAAYGVDARVVPPPVSQPNHDAEPVAGVQAGFVLSPTRLLRYKNVDAVVRAFDRLPDARLVVAGDGRTAAALGAGGHHPADVRRHPTDDGVAAFRLDEDDARRAFGAERDELVRRFHRSDDLDVVIRREELAETLSQQPLP
jgi:glycosyltransferase involved in cell wall biosynthesis